MQSKHNWHGNVPSVGRTALNSNQRGVLNGEAWSSREVQFRAQVPGMTLAGIAKSFDWKYTWASEGRSAYGRWHKALRGRDDWRREAPVARECLSKAAEATWWEWSSGSALFFWRWEEGQWRRWARDGQPHFLVGELPSYKVPQARFKTPRDRKLVKGKLDKVRARLYIAPGTVMSLTPMFHVPKGEEDVRMVYNARVSGLNKALWAPHFGLPTMRHTFRSLLPGYYQADMDAGEMFLNFWLKELLRPYVGVDV